ncbi:hypothetical protein ACFT0G_28260 [Streptomyces sp. NPDC057020]|uniref:hypothetical protein n=1 Tax=unclassified Streptomyces TaxID=2593676 RepID=UPI0036436A10
MRSVYVFPAGESTATVARPDRLMPGKNGYWTDGKLYIDLEDEQHGHLFAGWDPEDVTSAQLATVAESVGGLAAAVSGYVFLHPSAAPGGAPANGRREHGRSWSAAVSDGTSPAIVPVSRPDL